MTDAVGLAELLQDVWLEEARLQAILGSCARSKNSVKCGIRCYMSFVGTWLARCGRCAHVHVVVSDQIRPGVGTYFPPLLEDLLAWAKLFRCNRTYSNYLGYARVGCVLVKACDKVCWGRGHMACLAASFSLCAGV